MLIAPHDERQARVVDNTVEWTPAVRAVARNVRDAWRRHRPITASIWGDPILDRSEDLSAAGFDAWCDELNALQRQIKNVRRQGVTLADDVVCDELDRFCNRRKQEAERARRPQQHLAGCLHLIALGLAPFDVVGDADLMIDIQLLARRLTAAAFWIDLTLERAEAHSPAVVLTASLLARAIDDLASRAWPRHSEVQRSATNLSERLRSVEARGGETNSFRDAPSTAAELEEHLGFCFGLRFPLAKWEEAVCEWLDEALEMLLKCESEGRGLSMAGEAWDVSVWREVDSSADDAPDAPLRWMTGVYDTLRARHRDHSCEPQAPAARITRASPLLDIVTPEAMYLGSLSRGEPDRLVVASRLLASARMRSRRDRLYLALIVAHELSPGHQEHVWRGRRSALAEADDLLYNPAGLEGWGVSAERTVADVDPSALAICCYQRLRRLVPAALRLAQLRGGSEAVGAMQRQILRRNPTLPRELTATVASDAYLVYALGLVETERQLARVEERAARRACVARDAYLEHGPLTPQAAARLACAKVENAGV